MEMLELQKLARAWHDGYWRDDPNAAVALKLCEEAGEVARAVNGVEFTKAGSAHLPNLMDEIGDVGMVLMVLSSRYGWNFAGLVESRAMVVMGRPVKPERL